MHCLELGCVYQNDGSAPLELRFDRMQTFTQQKIEPSPEVLYCHPPEVDRMRSVDGLGWSGDTLYLLQPTIGRGHYRIVARHLNDILQTPLPEPISKVIALYVRPSHRGSFNLLERKTESGIKTQFANKSYSSYLVAVPGLTEGFSKELVKVLCKEEPPAASPLTFPT